jgi:membrane protein YdbS with pleckstrin-like domain
MSEILYQANPSMWRMRPMGTLLAWLLLAAGLLIGFTGELPYLGALLESTPALAKLQVQPRQLIAYAGYTIAVISAFNLLRWWLACLVDRLEIRPTEILWTHGLLAKNYTEISMSSVRTVRVHQSLLQRMLGAGDLVIFTTGDDPELAVRGLPRPNEIRDHIRQSATAKNGSAS